MSSVDLKKSYPDRSRPALMGSDQEQLQAKVDELTKRILCKICVSADTDILILPYRHFVVCRQCVENLKIALSVEQKWWLLWKSLWHRHE